MALKDCTYTVKVGGKTVTFDYDGFRSFLLDNKNLAAVAPVFAGKKPSAPSTATPAPKRDESELTFLTGTEEQVRKAKPDVMFSIQPGRQFFTLHASIRGATGQYPSTTFLRNLPSDPKEAMAEAEDYMRRIATGQVSGASFSKREGEFYARGQFKSYGLVASDLKAEDLITDEDKVGMRPISLGKHAGVLAKDLFDVDPEYAFWAADNMRSTALMREVSDYLRDRPEYSEMLNRKLEEVKAVFTPESRMVMKANKLQAVSAGAEVIVTGGTRKYKDLLKEVGGRYVPEANAWNLGADAYKKLVTRLQGKELFQAERLPSPQAPAKGKIDPADLVADLRGKVDLTSVPPVEESKHATAVDARRALLNLAKNSVREEMELQRLYREMRRVRQPLLQGTRGMTQAQVDKLEEEFNAAKDAYIQALAKQRLRAIDEVAPGGFAGITWEGYQTETETITTGQYSSQLEKAVKGISKDANQRIGEGVELFKRIVGDHPALRGKNLDVRILGRGEGNRRERYSFKPVDELEWTATPKKLTVGGGHVMLTAKSSNSTIVHEMGHWMEHAVPETTKRISQFLKRRAGKERLSSMSKLGGDSYHSDELGVKDEFITPYIGKYYAPGMPAEGDLPDWGRIQASEVLSMGLQYISEDPVKFAQQDPEMFDLIFDILRMGR